jgi:hypothetical protein
MGVWSRFLLSTAFATTYGLLMAAMMMNGFSLLGGYQQIGACFQGEEHSPFHVLAGNRLLTPTAQQLTYGPENTAHPAADCARTWLTRSKQWKGGLKHEQGNKVQGVVA